MTMIMPKLKSLLMLSFIMLLPNLSQANPKATNDDYYSADLDQAIAAAKKHSPHASKPKAQQQNKASSLNFAPISNQELGQRVIPGAIAATASSGLATQRITRISAKLTPLENLADVSISQDQYKTQTTHSAISNANADKLRSENISNQQKVSAPFELLLLEISDTNNAYGSTVIKNAGGQPITLTGFSICQTRCYAEQR